MDTILAPFYYIVSWIMMGWHWLFSQALGVNHDGIAWTLSIVGLVVVIRILLIPLFVRQIKSQRKMQMLQPKVMELRKKYKNDRERLQQETMKLYKESGTNPFASCLPIIAQAPVLFGLFRVLDGIARGTPRGGFTSQPELYESVANAEVGGIPITTTFLTTDQLSARIVAVIMIIIMVVTQFITQKQIMRKNMPQESLQGQFAQQQKILLYVLPLVFAVSGVYFPLGTVLYWLTSNFWTMGQQLYVIRRMPAPGTDAEQAHLDRLDAKARRKGQPLPSEVKAAEEAEKARKAKAERKQPQRNPRSQRKKK